METGKPLVSAPVHMSSIAAQAEKRMDNQAPLRAVYIHTLPVLPVQPYPQPTAAVREPATLHLAIPPYSNETLPFLTLHIAGGLQSQPGLSMAASAPAARPKSTGKHLCPHCGRDCMKPSVLEKHLRCHTGERPYPCTTCGVSFKTQSNLYKHKRTQAHARLSSESEQTSLGSLDSMSISRETCSSILSMDEHTCESGSMENDATLAPTSCPAHTTELHSVKIQSSISKQSELTPAGQMIEPKEGANATVEKEKQRVESEKPPLNVSRHLPLQRQEATLFSKQWESSVSSGKSQSHESTDSGFSESSDHYLSPARALPDHSMDSLTESTKEHLEESTSTNTLLELGQGGQELKDSEQKLLEERISKLISENKAVVEDKQLDNVRPRKTVLSKQGSIDLPMPYTYKDSFHFDMKISKTQKVGLQRNRAPGLYSSVPSQHSNTVEHAPLTRSNSLPFSVTLLQPERSSPTSSYQSDYVTLVRRGSSGQINPTSFTIKSVNQQSSTHRPLVRQTAVDCNHATDGHFINSSVEEVSTGSLSCDGDGGEISAEPSSRKFRRKKAQKFAYNKWYMYGGGTFKKLYNSEKGDDNTVIKGRKCLNPEHEVIQSSQKRLSAVHKETVMTSSMVNIANSSSAAVCHPGSPSSKPLFVSGLNFDMKTSQPHSLNSPLKSPLCRNLSLSVLPLPLEKEKLLNEEKHCDFPSHLCGVVPSDRKKQKTDDKMTMKTDLNTVTHSLPSVISSVPQQETNLSYTNFPENQQQAQVKEALFLPCIINANVKSVSTSPANSVSYDAKTSFLPKYQLKIPNVTESDSNSSMHDVDKPSGTVTPILNPAPPSSHTKENSPLVTTSESSCKEFTNSLFIQSSDNKNTNALSSTQAQLLFHSTATTICPAKTLQFYEKLTSSLPAVHRQAAATTITTTCLKNDHTGICSTLIQPSKSATDLAPIQLPTCAALVVASVPVRPAITTTNNQTSVAEITGQPTSNQPVSHLQHPPTLNLVKRAYVGLNTPAVPCHNIPFNQEQPVTQKVFHVHTADLQICLQIISDEQLALMEPQIERETGSSHSQRNDTEALAPEVIQNKAQNSVTMEISNKGTGHQQPGTQKETNQSGSLYTINANEQSPLSVHFEKGQPNFHMSGHSNSSKTALTVESKPPETSGITLRPHKHSNVSITTETLSSVSDVMSTAALLSGAKSEKHQTSDEEHEISLNDSVEERILLDKRVIKGQLVSETLSGQQNLSMACFSLGAGAQNSTRSDLLGNKSQDKLQLTTKAKGEYISNTLETGEIYHSPQKAFVQASRGDELSVPVFAYSINKCKSPKQENAQAWIYCSNTSEPTLSGNLNPSNHANRGCDRVGPLDNSAPLQEIVGESPILISSTHSEEQLGQFISVPSSVCMKKHKDNPAVFTCVQNPTAGVTEATSPVACAGQKESQAWGHRGSPGQPHSTLRLIQDPGETNQQCAQGQGGVGVTNTGFKTDQGEDLKVEEKSFQNPQQSEQHLQHLSQTHSGMYEYPPQSPQQASSTSKQLNLPSRGSQTSIFNLPQPLRETNNFYFSQQQQWKSSITHKHQTHNLCQSDLGKQIKEQVQLTEPQSAFSQTESNPRQIEIMSHQEQRQTLTIKQGNTKDICGFSSDAIISSTKHNCQVSQSAEAIKGTAGWTGNTQTSNSNMDTENSTGMSSKAFPYTGSEQETKAWPPSDYTTQSSNSGRSDLNNKYQSFFLTGQFHSFQPSECLNSVVRPVPSCLEYSEDTSSSDEEGKLIIEL